MRRVRLDNISPDMKLAKPLYSAEGAILFNAGVLLEDCIAKQLRELEVSYIYIVDDATVDIDVADIVSGKTRIDAIASMKKIADRARHGKAIDLGQVKLIAGTIVEDLSKSQDAMLNFIDMRTRSAYLFAHSVNVCILAVLTGLTLAYNKERLYDLAVGALLHDIGKTQLDTAVLNKKERLTPSEHAEISNHAALGFSMLRGCSDIGSGTLYCILQHHERINGSGYPRGLKKTKIHQFAQIVAIADTYDALTSDASYRKAVPVPEAVAVIRRAAGTLFNRRLVDVFLDRIAVYPIGSIVRLNNNQTGVVVDISREFKSRPVVRLLFDEHQQCVDTMTELDLSKNQRLYIVDVVER